MAEKYNRGSEWRKWDLHVHTPESGMANQFGNNWDDYVKDLFLKAIEKEIAVIGITDYFTIDGYKKLKTEYLEKDEKLRGLFTEEQIKKIKQITIFPNIEFRLHDIVKTNRINYHIIFSNDVSVIDIEENFLHDIEFVYEEVPFDTANIRKLKKSNIEELGAKIKTEQPEFTGSDFTVGCTVATIQEKQIQEILSKQKDKFDGKYLVVIPVDEDISKMGWTSQDHQVRKGFYQHANMFFATNQNTIDFGLGKKHPNKDAYLKEFKSFKPCICGSDAHKIDDLFVFNENKYCWIKADSTFEGLKQVLREPERVYIGEKPEIFESISNNRTKYIDNLLIKHVNDYKCSDIWFDNIQLDFNSELVAIIGNKGSGKSAIADILALCSNAKNYNDFSFLNDKKFKSKGLAKNFEAIVKFKDENTYSKNLFEEPTNEQQPLIKYFPQGYFEDLCNNFEKDEDFKKEIESIVFQYVKNEDKLGTSSFDDLIKKKTDAIDKQIAFLKSKLEIQCKEIIELEKKENIEYLKNIESKIAQKEVELKALIEPEKVDKPDAEDETAQQLSIKIEQLQGEVKEIKGEIEGTQKIIAQCNENISKLNDVKKQIQNQIDSINEFKLTIDSALKQFGIEINDVVKVTFEGVLIDNKINEFQLQKDEKIGKVNDCNKKLTDLEKKLAEETYTLNEPQKKYQKYLIELEDFNKRKLSIEGDSENPEAGTLNAYKKEKEYILNALQNAIQAKRKEQIGSAKLIYAQKKEITDIYQQVKESIERIIESNKELLKEYKFNISTSISLADTFNDKFLSFINQSKKGTFKGKLDGEKELNDLLANYDRGNVTQDDIDDLLNTLLQKLKLYKKDEIEEKVYIDDQINDLLGFYKYLFSLDYLETNYQLMQDNKDLKTLSPGEKGALLLVFYLLLDTDNKPLLLDQPEDNLDNNSVAKILVEFIRKAKKKRQIIMVTHNPNLAVVADADQVIKIDIQKHNNNKVIVKSGSIENPEINKCIVDVLEGTYPAFHNRDQKYINKA